MREPSALPSGRVPLYICEQCGDLGCQTVAVHVSEYEECVVWSSLAYDDINRRPVAGEVASSFSYLRDLYFLREQYEEAIGRFSGGYRMRPARR